MPSHDRHLGLVQLAGLHQHRVGDGDLAHVVQRGGHLDGAHVVLGQAHAFGHQPGHARHALQVGAGAGVAELDRARQARQRLALALLDFVHARQQPLLERQRPLLDRLRLLAQLEQVVAPRPQLARAYRLDQEVDHPRLQRRLPDRLVADDGDQDDRDVAVLGQPAEAAGELQPVHARHTVVEQQQVGGVVVAPGQRLAGVAEVVHGQLRGDVLDDVPQHRTRRCLIVDDDDVQLPFRPLAPRRRIAE